MNHEAASITAHVTGWDRTAVVVLGGAGCALSFSALQQMAVAIHIRPALCWLFPLVIDGFIAYGVRALLVLRTAPLPARLYVWTLFGTATAVSVWANALHAIRLNQETGTVTGLRLGDQVVAVLSTVAPLALAGAVHLYILVARAPANSNERRSARDTGRRTFGQPGHSGQPRDIPVTGTDRAGQHSPQPGQMAAGHPFTELTDRPPLSRDKPHADAGTATHNVPSAHRIRRDTGHRNAAHENTDLAGHPVIAPQDSVGTTNTEPAVGESDSTQTVGDRPIAARRATDRRPRYSGDRPDDPDTGDLLAIARSAVEAEDRLTRKVVAQAIRGQKIPLSNDTLTQLMIQLRAQHGQPVTASRR